LIAAFVLIPLIFIEILVLIQSVRKKMFIIFYVLDWWNLLALAFYLIFIITLGYAVTNPIPQSIPWKDSTQLILTFKNNRSYHNDAESLMATTIILAWCLFVRFLRAFEFFGVLIVVLFNMFKDFFVLICVYFLFTLGFAGALSLLLSPYDNTVDYWGYSMVFLIRIGLGELNWNHIFNTGNVYATLLLLAYVVVSFLLLLNLLIAMLNTSFATVVKSAKHQYMMERAKLITSYTILYFYSLCHRSNITKDLEMSELTKPVNRNPSAEFSGSPSASDFPEEDSSSDSDNMQNINVSISDSRVVT